MTAAAVSAIVQQLVVAAAVVACTVYVAWALAPAALRRPIALWLLRRHRWLAASAALQAASRRGSAGCACDGCDKGAGARPAAPGSGRVIRIVARSDSTRPRS